MREFINKILIISKLPSFYFPFIGSLFFNALCWLLILWRLPISINWIPLHFNTFFGIDWIGPWIQIFIYPALGLAIIIINLLINILVFLKEKYISFLLNYSALITQFIIFTGLIIILIRFFS